MMCLPALARQILRTTGVAAVATRLENPGRNQTGSVLAKSPGYTRPAVAPPEPVGHFRGRLSDSTAAGERLDSALALAILAFTGNSVGSGNASNAMTNPFEYLLVT